MNHKWNMKKLLKSLNPRCSFIYISEIKSETNDTKRSRISVAIARVERGNLKTFRALFPCTRKINVRICHFRSPSQKRAGQQRTRLARVHQIGALSRQIDLDRRGRQLNSKPESDATRAFIDVCCAGGTWRARWCMVGLADQRALRMRTCVGEFRAGWGCRRRRRATKTILVGGT